MRKILVVCASIYLTSCNTADQELHFKPPIQIDSSTHQTIKNRFKLSDLDPAPSYWGGLTPAYPIGSAFIPKLLSDDCREPKWRNQGMIAGCSKLVIKKDTSYILIGTRDELQKIYSPIADKQEALSYASIYFGYFPVTTPSFFKPNYIYNRSKMISSADSLEDYFIVHLYDKEVFGCGPHPYYYAAIKVFRDGRVQELLKVEAFRDPKEDILCVD